jgi:succinate dehydrogenase/fumarate reductase cytochrome b subunit
MTPFAFRVGWIAWIVFFLVWEGLALSNPQRRDTLSEQVWAIQTNSFVRFMVAGFTLWLVFHFVFERGG